MSEVVKTATNDRSSISSSEKAKKASDLESLNEKTVETNQYDNDSESIQEGNKEIYRQAWSKKVLYIAYFVLIFAAFVENFASQSTSGLDSYATSAFDAHALISTAAVVFKITAIVSYPLLGKLADFLGRAEGFGLSVLIYTLAYVLYAACQNVQTYVCAEIFYAIGKVGYRVFQQTFIADTTSLIDRGLWAQLPDAVASVPALYIGSILQDEFIDKLTWRYGYGIWCICLFFTTLPLTAIMYYLDKRAKRTGEQKIIEILQDMPEGKWYKKAYHFLFKKLDILGGMLFILGLALFFVPLTLTGTSNAYEWKEARLIIMLCFGFSIFMLFLFWNSAWISNKLNKTPFVQPQSLTNRTVFISCILVALDLCENSSFSTYFKTMLQVSGYYTVGEAVRIDDSKKCCLQIFSVVAGVCMKYTKRARIYVWIGIPFVVLGHGLLVYFINTGSSGKGMASTALLYMAEVFIGFGRGFYQSGLLVTVQGIAGSQGIPMSTAFFLAFQSIGSLIGSCIAGGIWNTIVLSKLNKYLPTEDKADAKKIYKALTTALKYKEGTEARDAIARAYRETVQLIGWAGLGVIAPMVILMFFVQGITLTKHNDIYATDSESEDVEVDAVVDAKKDQQQKKQDPIASSD